MIALAIIVGLVVAFTVHAIVRRSDGGGRRGIRGTVIQQKKDEARAMCSPTCTGPERAVVYVGWSGTVETFDIPTEKYALAFMLSNRQKLINVSAEKWAKLEAAAHAATSAPAHRISLVPTTVPTSPNSVTLATGRCGGCSVGVD